jgi:ADP-ribose pyrophosphatase YjhB (NUDIX family)
MGREYPDRPMVGVGAVVWRDGRVLLVKRAKPPRQGQWSLPGGLQEIGETVADAARRELREETGLEIEVLEVAEVVDYIERDEQDRVRFHYALVDFLAVAPEGEAVAAGDAAAVRWFGPEDLPGLALPPDTERVALKALAMLTARGRTR